MRLSIKLLCIYSLLFKGIAFAQFPGGIGTNLKVWLKSDNGLTVTGTSVTQWADGSASGITGNFSVNQYNFSFPTQTAPTVLQAGINFNNYVVFNGITNSLSSNTAFPGTQAFDAHNNTIFQVIRYKTGGVWFKWETDVGGTHRVGFESNSGSLRFDFPEAIASIGINNLSTVNIAFSHELSTSVTDATNSLVRLNGLNSATKNISTAGAFTDGGSSQRLVLGNNLMFNLPAQIDMSEVITYNTKLAAVDINKVESYLAIKYGFTLNQSIAQNYVASNGTVVWDALANSTYNSDITGIARDDNSTLNQKQSRNNSLNDAVTMSLGSIAIDNAANPSLFNTDNSFLTWGHNGLALTSVVSTNLPNGLSQCLNRVWKAEQTNFSQPVTLSFETAMLPASMPIGSIRLLVDDDGNFSNAKVYSGSVNAGRLEFTSQDFDSFSKLFFTLASCNSTAPTLSYNNPLCPGQTLVLQTATPTYTDPTTSYTWSGPGSFSASTSSVSIANASPAISGTYSLIVSVNTCTLPAGTVSVTVQPLPNINPGTSQTITCSSPTVTLSGSSLSSPVSYSWAGTTGSISATQQASVTSSGTYTLTITNTTSGCISTATINVTTDTIKPTINAGPSQTITCTSTATLIGSTSSPNVSYSWAGPSGFTSSTQFPTTNAIGNYSLTVTNLTNGCSNNATTSVLLNNNLVITSTPSQATICLGDTVILALSGAQSYTCQPGSTSAITQPFYVSPSVSTNYVFTGTQGLCSATVVVPVIVNPVPTASFTTSYTDEANFDGTLQTVDHSIGATSWSWDFGDGSSSVSAQSPLHVYDAFKPDSYTIIQTVTNSFSCTSQATFEIRVAPITVLYIPNAFTPNGDGLNDTFGGIGTGINRYELLVFSRWGQLIFSSDSMTNPWDGTFKGAICEQGAYAYKITILDIYQNRKTYTGFVQVLPK